MSLPVGLFIVLTQATESTAQTRGKTAARSCNRYNKDPVFIVTLLSLEWNLCQESQLTAFIALIAYISNIVYDSLIAYNSNIVYDSLIAYVSLIVYISLTVYVSFERYISSIYVK